MVKAMVFSPFKCQNLLLGTFGHAIPHPAEGLSWPLSSSVGMKERKGSRSVVSDSVASWTVACQAPPSMEFPRQEYWSGSPFPSPGDHPDPGIEPGSPALQADVFTV